MLSMRPSSLLARTKQRCQCRLVNNVSYGINFDIQDYDKA